MINAPTLEALDRDIHIKDTILGETFTNAVQERGGTPIAWKVWQERGKTYFDVSISY